MSLEIVFNPVEEVQRREDHLLQVAAFHPDRQERARAKMILAKDYGYDRNGIREYRSQNLSKFKQV